MGLLLLMNKWVIAGRCFWCFGAPAASCSWLWWLKEGREGRSAATGAD